MASLNNNEVCMYIFPRDSQKEVTGESIGFVFHPFASELDNTFHMSNYLHFKNFILNPLRKNKINNATRLSGVCKKWMIASDYVFGDKNKQRNVISFSIFPYLEEFNNLKEGINNLQPNDLKKTLEISDNFINFLNHYPLATISISINKDARLHTDERQLMKEKIDSYIRMVKLQKTNDTKNENLYSKRIKRLESFKNAIVRTGANLSVVRQIEIVSTLVSYLMFQITILIPDIELISWLSDRDKILNFNKNNLDHPIIFDFINAGYLTLCRNYSPGSNASVVFGIPEETGNMWYDEIIRVSDYFAGTLANIKPDCREITPKGKFAKMLVNVFTNTSKHLFFGIDIKYSKKESIIACERYVFSKKQ